MQQTGKALGASAGTALDEEKQPEALLMCLRKTRNSKHVIRNFFDSGAPSQCR